jgi:tyrosine-protein kinase Etk/Wzc
MKESMNAQSNLLSGSQQKQSTEQAQEIDLMALLGALLDRKWFIIAVTVLIIIGAIWK